MKSEYYFPRKACKTGGEWISVYMNLDTQEAILGYEEEEDWKSYLTFKIVGSNIIMTYTKKGKDASFCDNTFISKHPDVNKVIREWDDKINTILLDQ